MLYRSTAYKNAIKGTVRNFNAHIRFNGTATEVRANTGGIVSIKHYSSVADAERPMFGCAVSSYIEATWLNSAVSGVSLANSYIDVWIGPVYMSGGFNTYDPKYLGRFWIADISRGDTTTTVTAYDELSKLSKEYVPTVTPTGGVYNISDIVDDIVSQCGLGYAASTLTGTVDTLYSGTCREVLGWVCNVTSDSTFNGCNIKPHRIANSTTPQNLALNTASLYTAWQTKDDYEIDENTIYLGGLDDAEDFEVQSVVSGTNDAPVSVGSGTGLVGPNPYMTNTIATDIYNNVNGITFTPMTIEFRGDPAIEIGDVVKVTKGGVSKYCYIQRFVTHFDGGLKQDLYCYGDSEYYYDMSTSPTTAKINTVSTMLQEIAQSIETANGGVITKILDTDGTWKELVIANSVDLNTATSVWRWNINGLAHSTSYSGGTYNFALDDQGRMIANIIQTGILQDANGYNSWNLDTGAFTITNGSLNITTSAETYDAIQLNYGSYTMGISPVEIKFVRGSYYAIVGSRFGSLECGSISGGTEYETFLTMNGSLRLGGGNGGGVDSGGAEFIRDGSAITKICLAGVAGRGITGSLSSIDGIALRTGSSDTVWRTQLTTGGLNFYDSGGTQTATYPSDASTFFTDNTLRTKDLAGNQSYYYSSAGSATYTLETLGLYLVATARANNSSTAYSGMWLVSVHNSSGTANIMPILTPSNSSTTASITGNTLTVSRGATYSRVAIIRLT